MFIQFSFISWENFTLQKKGETWGGETLFLSVLNNNAEHLERNQKILYHTFSAYV